MPDFNNSNQDTTYQSGKIPTSDVANEKLDPPFSSKQMEYSPVVTEGCDLLLYLNELRDTIASIL